MADADAGLPMTPGRRGIFKLDGKVYAFDATAINLCLSVFEWALFRKKKGD